MLLKKDENKKVLITVALILFGVAVLGVWYFIQPEDTKDTASTMEEKTAISRDNSENRSGTGNDQKVQKETGQNDVVVQGDIVIKPDIDYKDLKEDQSLKELMISRKKKLGINKSLDMIVHSDESFKIGDTHISMSKILEQAFVNQGEVFQEKIEESGAIRPQKIKEFGIYVVQPGDNIWNIHFNILKEYYEHQGINVSPKADEPLALGKSSGVGKILKFSETMVIIYNLIEKKVDTDIDLLEPLSKIVVYNMDEVFSLLREINYENIERIQFDGKNIWIPTEKL